MNRNDILSAVKFTDRDIIDEIIESYYFIDYGIIDKVSDDKKKVDVIHAIKPVLMDDTILDATTTKEVELLYPCCENFSINWEVKKDDLVLLVGTKDLVKIDGLEEANKPKMFSHYQQENLKAIPFGTKTVDAKNRIIITADDLTIENDKGSIVLDKDGNIIKDIEKDYSLTGKGKYTVDVDSDIEIGTSGTKASLKTTNETIAIDTALLDLHNQVSDLRTEIENLWDAIGSILTILTSWSSTNCVVGNPVTPDAATLANIAADIAQNAITKANVALLLK